MTCVPQFFSPLSPLGKWQPKSHVKCFLCVSIFTLVTVTEQLSRHRAGPGSSIYSCRIFLRVAEVIHSKHCCLCGPQGPPSPAAPTEMICIPYQIRAVCSENEAASTQCVSRVRPPLVSAAPLRVLLGNAEAISRSSSNLKSSRLSAVFSPQLLSHSYSKAVALTDQRSATARSLFVCDSLLCDGLVFSSCWRSM